jgi:hypothetical protein
MAVEAAALVIVSRPWRRPPFVGTETMLSAVANGRFPRASKLVADSESATPPPDLAIRREHKLVSRSG